MSVTPIFQFFKNETIKKNRKIWKKSWGFLCKHILGEMFTKNPQKIPKKFYCEKCDYSTNNKKDYNKHLQTKKHNVYKCLQNVYKKSPFLCECGKSYQYRQSMSRHKKTCDFQKNETMEINPQTTNTKTMEKMFLELMEKNQNLQEQLIELAKEPKTIINQQNNTTFNMENFLHVQCKDAMNLSDFLDQIEFSFDDLLYLGEHGFINSVKSTFIRQLSNLEQTKRPIHCSDQKRKIMMVKNEDRWHKDENHNIIHDAIDQVNRKQLAAFTNHSKERPNDYLDDERNLDNQNKIIIEMCRYNKGNENVIHKKIINDVCSLTKIKK